MKFSVSMYSYMQKIRSGEATPFELIAKTKELGFDAIEGRWKNGLELYDVLMELADDLCIVQQLPPDTPLPPEWIEKYARS